jgi:hypothetical protein
VTIVSYLYGRKIYSIDEVWYWADDKTPIGDSWRSCPHCKKDPAADCEDPPDPCLGWLPGVKFACCGHGYTNRAYVLLEGESNYRRGKDALMIIERLRREL